MGAFVLSSYMGGVPLVYSTLEIGYTSRIPFFPFSNNDFSKFSLSIAGTFSTQVKILYQQELLHEKAVTFEEIQQNYK